MEAPKGRDAYFAAMTPPPLTEGMVSSSAAGNSVVSPPAPLSPDAVPPSVPYGGPTPSAPLPPKLPPLPNSDSRAMGGRRMRHGEPEGFPEVPPVPVLFDNEATGEDGKADTSVGASGPEVLLEPLHILDPLCVKWGLGVGMVRREARPEAALPQQPQAAPQHTSVPVFPGSPSPRVPVSSEPGAGYLRLTGLLPSRQPWECTLPFSELRRPTGIVIGRDPSCSHVVLQEDSVSRRHVLLEYIDNRPVVTDMGSTNGTFVNGRRLAPTERRVPAEDGYTLMLGEIPLRAELLRSSPNFRPM